MKRELRSSNGIRFKKRGREPKRMVVFPEHIYAMAIDTSILYTPERGDSLQKAFQALSTRICRMKKKNQIPANVSVCNTHDGQIAIRKWDPLGG